MAWYNSSWLYRKKVTILSAAVDSDLTDQTVWIRLADLGTHFFNNVQADGDDIRITQSDGTTEQAYDLVEIDTSGNTGSLHFKASSLSSSSDTDFYVYYGNSGAAGYGEGDTYGKHNAWRSAYKIRGHCHTDPTSSVADATGNSNDYTGLNMEAGDLVDGGLDKAYDLDGTNEHLDTDAAFTDMPAGDFSVMGYAKRSAGGAAYKGVVGHPTSSHANGLFFLQRDGVFAAENDEYQFSVTNTSGTFFKAYSDNASGDDSGNYVHLVGTYNNSSGAVTLYKDGTAQATTATLTGTRSVKTGNLLIGAVHFGGATTNYWDDEISEFAILDEVLSAAQIKAESINFLTPESFYTVAGEEDESTAKYQWTFEGRERTWTVKIIEEGFEGTTTTLCAGSEMRVTWGRGTNGFDDRLRAAELMLEVVDPDLAVYNDLIDATAEEEDFSITLTDSTSTYTLRMRIRLDETSTWFVSGLQEQITRIYGYCGIAEMRNIDAVVTSSSTFHNLIRFILASSAVGQDIEYLIQHYPANISSSGALLSLMRLNRLDLQFSEGGRKVDTMYSQLKGLAEGFGVVVLNGLDGQWHVKHEYGLGETISGKRGAQKYTHSSGLFTTLNTLTGNSFSLVNALLARDTLRRPVRPVQAVQLTRGNDRDFITVDMVRHGDFENGWVSSTEHHDLTPDDATGGTYSRTTNSDTGTYALKIDDGSWAIDHRMLVMAGGYQDIDLEIALRYANESTSGSTSKSGTSGLKVFWDANAQSVAGDPGGDWTTDPINGAIALNAAIVASGSALNWSTVVTTVYGPMPDEDGQLRIQYQGSLTNYKMYLDTVEVRLKSSDSGKNRFISVDARYDLITNEVIGKGDVVEQSRVWWNGVLGLDPTDDGTRDETVPMIQVLTTPAGSWVRTSHWLSEVSGFTAEEYDDLFELTGAVRRARQNAPIDEIEGDLVGICPPDYVITYDAVNYTQVYTSIDLKDEITSFVARKKLLATSEETTNPTTLYWGDSDGDINKATIDSTSVPWSKTNITSVSAGRTIMTGHVDEVAGYIFTLEHISALSLNKLMRRDLDGSNGTELLSWDSNSGNASGVDFNLARSAEFIAVIITELPLAGNNYVIRKYDYSGTFLGTLKTKTGRTKASAVCFSPDESLAFYTDSLGASDRPLEKLTIATDTEDTLISNTTQDASGETNELVMDPLLNRLWHSGSNSGVWLINYVDTVSGGSETTYKDNTDGIPTTGRGLAIHRFHEKIIFPQSGGDIAWDNKDGVSNEEIIYDPGAGSQPTIKFLCTGYV